MQPDMDTDEYTGTNVMDLEVTKVGACGERCLNGWFERRPTLEGANSPFDHFYHQETRHILFHIDGKLDIVSTTLHLVTAASGGEETTEEVKYTREFRFSEHEYWVIEAASNLMVTDDQGLYLLRAISRGFISGLF